MALDFEKSDCVDVVAFSHPLRSDFKETNLPYGSTVSDIVAKQNIRPELLPTMQVTLSKGDNVSVVPLCMWDKVRPKTGTVVLLSPRVQAPALALLPALIAAAAPTIAGTVFGLAAGSLGFSLAVAAITIVGALAVNALIPPPKTPGKQIQDDPNFSITGSSNVANKYGVVPVVLGRHEMHPPRSASGFTEALGDEIYYYGRYTFGYGPVSLETLRIGTTPITDYDGVEIEFRNVDQTLTSANIEGLSNSVIAWRSGDDRMTLYPDNIAEDSYSVKLEAGDEEIIIGQETYLTYPNQTFGQDGDLGQPVPAVRDITGPAGIPAVRETRDRARKASIDISFQGLVLFDGNGSRHEQSVLIGFRYRKAGDADWIDAGDETFTGLSTALLRYSKEIVFPEEGKYEIEVRRKQDDNTDATIRNDSYLSAIRTVRSGQLPSHPDLAEVAIRIRASDQLNGQVDTLNAVVQMLAPVWDGAAWSDPVPVRHPAWVMARSLRGPMLSKPRADETIQIGDLLAWAIDEPHWTCDAVLDQDIRFADALDFIAACGRAKRTLRDLKYSVVRDGGAGPVTQHFSQRNSYGFKGKVIFPKEIHGFRIRVISEKLGWQQDEIIVYADGYDASNATEFETLDLPGVILSKDDVDGGNAWRLGRYHLAQAILRPEEFTFHCDLEHLPCAEGTKFRLVHDVPLLGVGSARISATSVIDGEVKVITLDETFDLAGETFRFRGRSEDGVLTAFFARSPADDTSREWVVLDPNVSTLDVKFGDLVLIEETTKESFEGLVTKINHDGDLQAMITAVPASPAVLLADQGTIPAYDPLITDLSTIERPASPVVAELITGAMTALNQAVGPDLARVGVRLQRFSFGGAPPAFYKMRWREVGQSNWSMSSMLSPADVIYSEVLEPFRSYEIEVQSLSETNRTKGWVSSGSIYVFASEQFPGPVENFKLHVVDDNAFLTWDRVNSNVSHYELRHSGDPQSSWDQSILISSRIETTSATVPAVAGAYLIKSVSYEGNKSPEATIVTLSGSAARNANVVEVIKAHPDFTGDVEGDLNVFGDKLLMFASADMTQVEDVFDLDDVFAGGVVPSSATYQLSNVLDLGAVVRSRVSADMRGQAYLSDFDIFDVPDVFEIQDVFGDVDGQWGMVLQISTTPDNPTGAAIWSDWTDFALGDYEARGFRFRVVFNLASDRVVIELSELSITVDMPDRQLSGNDVDCPIGGALVVFDKGYFAKPSIVVRGQGLPAQARSETTQVSKTGFHQEFLDKDGNPIAASFDWQAAGYGRIE